MGNSGSSATLSKVSDGPSPNHILLLGVAESGKTTYFRQFNTLYGPGVREDEAKSFVPAIHQLVLGSVKILAGQAVALKSEMKEEFSSAALESLTKIANDYKSDADNVIAPEQAAKIQELWETAALKELYGLRFGKYYIPDSAQYFLDKVAEIADPDYVPTDSDLLKMLTPTTEDDGFSFSSPSITEKLLIVDVGGRKIEKAKWQSHFEKANVIVFCVGVSDYDNFGPEGSSQNRLREALEAFDLAVNSPELKDIPVFLLLNKINILEEKILSGRVPLKAAFPDYAGRSDDLEEHLRFIEAQFLRLNKNPSRSVFVHRASAIPTDTLDLMDVTGDICKLSSELQKK